MRHDVVYEKTDLSFVIIYYGQARAFGIPCNQWIVRLQEFVVGPDTTFHKHFPVYKIFMQNHAVLTANEFNHCVSLAPWRRVGREIEIITLVAYLFHNGDTAFREVSPSANILFINVFFLRHEILQY